MIRALPFVFMLACSVEPSNMAGFLGPQAQLEDDDAVAEAFLATLLPLALPHEAGRHHDDACPIRTEWEGGFALDGGCTTVDGARFVGSYVEEKLDSTTTFIRYEAWEAHGRDGTMQAHGEQIRRVVPDGEITTSEGLEVSFDVSVFGPEIEPMVSVDTITASFSEYEFSDQRDNVIGLTGGVDLHGAGAFWVDIAKANAS